MAEEVFTSMEQVRKRFFPNVLPPGRITCPVCRGKKTVVLMTCECCEGKGHIACPHCAPGWKRSKPGDRA